MLRPLGLVDDFERLERSLPDDWAEAQLQLTVADDGRCDRAAALLGPGNLSLINISEPTRRS
jgi:hypothetical protein